MRYDPEHATLMLPVNSSWDSFADDIAPWLEQLELQVHRRESGADRHQWWVSFEGTELRLEYEDLSGCTWLAADNDDGQDVLAFLTRFHQLNA
ncbi:DUF3630 family protein [Gallaecimonas sp. GXIMD1310]|uniref:DUF3630 family protein n=1 Tax=Gallaecimonas sp. GXIMD1310 TaxID=3131926 RepID=UPI0032508C22